MEPLNQRQQAMYTWIKQFVDREGRSPSPRQIMNGMNIRSFAVLQSILDPLIAKGYLEKGT
jgi:SOS-response transcriptional repressor LexA